MMRLWDEGPQRQVDLVRNLDSDAPTVNRSVRRLEQAGFVRRAPSPTDRRAAIIEATPASMSLRKEVQRVWSDLEALTAGDMSEDERQQTLTALRSGSEPYCSTWHMNLRGESARWPFGSPASEIATDAISAVGQSAAHLSARCTPPAHETPPANVG
jgi:DNA-binding MarR family transcriptional regulator